MVMRLACDEIAQRLERTVKAIPTIHSNEDIYYLVLKGESFTVGNIVVKGICEQYPDIKAITPQYDPLTKTMTLAIRTDQDVETILLDVCKKNVKVINEIKSHFEK
jgi:DNA-directed RNA polymerase subunit L